MNDKTTVQVTSQIMIVNVPCRVSPKYGKVVHASVLLQCERLALKGIVQYSMPIRGAEIALLRKHLGMSARAFADEMCISHPAVLEWEKKLDQELEDHRQISVRLFIMEHFHMKPREYSYLKKISRPDLNLFTLIMRDKESSQVCA